MTVSLFTSILPTTMKTLLALALLFAALPAAAQSTAVSHPELQAELAERFAAEQALRMTLISRGAFTPDSLANPSPELAEILAEMAATDADNLAFVEAMIAEHGWPTPAMVGADGASATFFIVQHATLEVQKRMLPLALAAWHAGDMQGQHYAMLLDRVLVSRGEPQVYGTQATTAPDGTMSVLPSIDDETLDARRTHVGLPPVAVYLEAMRQAYAPADAN